MKKVRFEIIAIMWGHRRLETKKEKKLSCPEKTDNQPVHWTAFTLALHGNQ